MMSRWNRRVAGNGRGALHQPLGSSLCHPCRAAGPERGAAEGDNTRTGRDFKEPGWASRYIQLDPVTCNGCNSRKFVFGWQNAVASAGPS